MKRYLGVLLVALNAALVLVLAWLWFKPNGELKNSHWQEPRGQKAAIEDLVPAIGKPEAMDQKQFLAMLDRPLFSATRRPPPPPPPPPVQAPPPPPDYLAGAVLSGVYMTEDGKSGGVIIKFQGKDKSLPLQGVLDGWTLSSVAANRVYFTRGGETKEITLQKGKLQTGYGPSADDPMAQALRDVGAAPRQDQPAPRRSRSSAGGSAPASRP